MPVGFTLTSGERNNSTERDDAAWLVRSKPRNDGADFWDDSTHKDADKLIF